MQPLSSQPAGVPEAPLLPEGYTVPLRPWWKSPPAGTSPCPCPPSGSAQLQDDSNLGGRTGFNGLSFQRTPNIPSPQRCLKSSPRLGGPPLASLSSLDTRLQSLPPSSLAFSPQVST